MVGREPGVAIKVVCPTADGVSTPPGQGQVLVPLRGAVRVVETSDGTTKVTQTDRRSREARLGVGQLWRVANDAAWALVAESDAPVVLQISTSVPREESRADDLLAAAERRWHMGPRRVFGNEVVRVETAVGRTRLPGLGWVWWDHEAEGTEYALILAGSFRARLREGEDRWEGTLGPGALLAIPPGVAHNFAARTWRRPSVGLIVTSLRRVPTGEVNRESVRGFSPFVDRG